MLNLRNLLLDCRSALRRADPGFESGTLRPRLDQTIIAMSQTQVQPEAAAAPQSFAAQQVAYAWQQAARELHLSHPALYAELGERVRERLQSDTFVDPGTEILQLQAQLHSAQAEHEPLHLELSELRAALAAAVTLEGPDARGNETECALRRIRLLLGAATRGGGLPHPRPQRSDDIAPTPAALQQVRQGMRAFTQPEREWCVGEVMVRSGFRRDPAQLLADGDNALAALLLEDALRDG